MTRITIVTDAWHPQVNGVVRSIENTNTELARLGVDVRMVTPQSFTASPARPIRKSACRWPVIVVWRQRLKSQPSFVHIATEGPLGFMARRWCVKNHMRFSTSYHTRFPEYVAARFPSRKAGFMLSCAGSTMAATPAWWPHRASRPNWKRAAFATSSAGAAASTPSFSIPARKQSCPSTCRDRSS